MNGNYEQKLDACSNELNHIQAWINRNPIDSNVKYLTSYAVIKASGTIEQVLKEMLFDTISVGGSDEAKTYFNRNIIEASFNPSTKKIANLLPQMSREWYRDFLNRTNGSTQKEQLDSLVDLRNSFSHGNEITTSIGDVINYFDSGKWVLEQLGEVLSS